jgi:hypothetical protein
MSLTSRLTWTASLMRSPQMTWVRVGGTGSEAINREPDAHASQSVIVHDGVGYRCPLG